MNYLPIAMVSMPGPLELVIILMVVLLLFGAKRMPEIARGMGQGIKEFKKSISEISSGESKDKSDPKSNSDSTEPKP